MKNFFIVCILFLCTESNAQVLDTIIDNSFSGSLDIVPIRLKKGDRLKIETNSPVYLLNSERYEFCKGLTNGDCEDHYEALLHNFKESIAERDKLMKSLSAINDSTQVQANRLIQVYEANLKETRLTLNSTQEALSRTKDNITEMQKTIKEVRTENFMKKFWVGAGCAGVGLILGVLLGR